MKSKLIQEDHLTDAVPSSMDISNDKNMNKVKKFSSPLILPNRISSHHPKAGVNLIVDAAGYLFSVMGKLKQFKSYKQLGKLQTELIQEINIFFDAIQNYKYGSDYIVVCRYVLCATLDEIILNTSWGGRGWENYSLLNAFNQDIHHQDKFFSILERIVKEPEIYIDLMELMYLCLSMGYKGHYRTTEHNQHHLEQITNHLYKHIRAYRGNFSKVLSPAASSNLAPRPSQKKISYLFLFILTACIIMTIFISLGYIMDIISNESYQDFTPLSHTETP